MQLPRMATVRPDPGVPIPVHVYKPPLDDLDTSEEVGTDDVEELMPTKDDLGFTTAGAPIETGATIPETRTKGTPYDAVNNYVKVTG